MTEADRRVVLCDQLADAAEKTLPLLRALLRGGVELREIVAVEPVTNEVGDTVAALLAALQKYRAPTGGQS